MKLIKKSIPPIRLEMTPLMDIVFLLLVFFIYSMMSMAVHHGKSVVLPSSSSTSIEMQEAVSITIQAGKNGMIVSIGDEEPLSDLALLQETLTKKKLAAKDGKEPDVQIFADKAVAYQELFQVLDSISKAGLTRISLQAKHQEQDVP